MRIPEEPRSLVGHLIAMKTALLHHWLTNVRRYRRQFILRRDQIWVLITKDFKLKYNSTALGFVWSLLMPTFTSVVYYLVFGVMMRFGVDPFSS